MIYGDDVRQQVNVYKRFRSKCEKRKTYLGENENMKQKRNISTHGISLIDPLYTVLVMEIKFTFFFSLIMCVWVYGCFRV